MSSLKSRLLGNKIVKNSAWGIVAQLVQSVLLSLFFVILARQYPTEEFATFAVVNVVYQLVLAFSALGLNQWFIREFSNADDKLPLLNKFFKIQFFLGLIFYVINVVAAFCIYDSRLIHTLCAIVGINIIFDNIINAVKCVNIAMGEQKKTFMILTVESVLKFLASCLLFVFPLSIATLSVVLIAVRFVSLNLFLTYGSSNLVSLKSLIKFKISFKDVLAVVLPNWPFIIIGAVSMVNWRISTIIISKMLAPFDIANYEISYKLFTIAQILPIIISTSVFPSLIQLYHTKKIDQFKSLYKKVGFYYTLLGISAYLFIYVFSDYFVPVAFGAKYAANPYFTKQMFLTMLMFPTAFLQANMLIAMKLEKLDMYFNIILLVVNVTLCVAGLYYNPGLSVVNYAIFAGFVVFHLCQDVALIRHKIASVKQTIQFYGLICFSVVSFILLSSVVSSIFLFILYLSVGCIAILYKANPDMFRSIRVFQRLSKRPS